MTVMTDIPTARCPRPARACKRTLAGHVIAWLRANLFATIPSTIITLLLIAGARQGAGQPRAMGLLNAVWSVPDGNNSSACRAVPGSAPAGR